MARGDAPLREGRPIIDIDLTQDYALSALAHERAHLVSWREEKEKLERQGLSPKRAAIVAADRLADTRTRVESERSAVRAEMGMEARDTSEWNRGYSPLPRNPQQPGFARRVSYPEVQGVRDLLHRQIVRGEKLDSALASEYVRKIIFVEIDVRRRARRHLFKAAQKESRKPDVKRGSSASASASGAGRSRTATFSTPASTTRPRTASAPTDILGALRPISRRGCKDADRLVPKAQTTHLAKTIPDNLRLTDREQQ